MEATAARWSSDSAVVIAAAIASASALQSMIDAARRRPRCRSPMFTVGVRTEGASMMPLEELPTTASAARRALR